MPHEVQPGAPFTAGAAPLQCADCGIAYAPAVPRYFATASR